MKIINDIKNIITDIYENGDLTQEELRDPEVINEVLDIVSSLIGFIYAPEIPPFDKVMIEGRKILEKYIMDDVVYMSLVDRDEHTLPLSESDIEELKDKFKYLDEQPRHKQRSDEWYKTRDSMITASDLATALGKSHYNTRNDLIVKKCGVKKPFIAGKAIKHGVKYEDVAVKLYSERNKVRVKEYGCIRHRSISCLGASPDGICSLDSPNTDLIGRMLEIKCPTSRKITGIPPINYAIQVQAQLEVCNLGYCDFLECKITEYNYESYLQNPSNEKGCVITYYDKNENTDKFFYSDLGLNAEQMTKWKDMMFDEILENDNLEYIETSYWKLEKYSCVLLKRSKEWFNSELKNIKKFWEDVEFYREYGHEVLMKDKVKKTYEKKKTYKTSSNGSGFLSDIEDEMNDNKLIPLMYPIIIKINKSRVPLKKIVFIK